MKELKLYRENNGQYSTSEARQDDVSGSYVQKTDYDELRRDNYDQRAKIQQLEIERDELRASVSVLVFAMTKDIDKTGENFRLQEALDKTPSQHLADIQADAVVALTEQDYGYSVEIGGHTDEWVISVDQILDYASKLRGESK